VRAGDHSVCAQVGGEGGGILGGPFPLCSYAEQYFGPGTRLTVLGKKLAPGKVDYSAWTTPLNQDLREVRLGHPGPFISGDRRVYARIPRAV
jgi:hypothetical protein